MRVILCPHMPAPSSCLPMQDSPVGAIKAPGAIPNERRLRQIQQSEMMGRVRALQGDQDGPAATIFVPSQVRAVSMLLCCADGDSSAACLPGCARVCH